MRYWQLPAIPARESADAGDTSAPAAKSVVADKPFAAAGKITMELDGGLYVVRATADNHIRVALTGNTGNATTDLTATETEATVQVKDTPRNFHATIEVPAVADLVVRFKGGELVMEPITGNKDVQSYGGEIKIGIGNPDEYSSVDASVKVGEIDASAFGGSNSGLLPHFTWSGKGKYHPPRQPRCRKPVPAKPIATVARLAAESATSGATHVRSPGSDPTLTPRGASPVRIEPIPDPRLSHQIAGVRGIGLELLPQLPHEHAQILRLFLRRFAPHRLEQRAMRDDTVRMARHVHEEVELLRREPHLGAARVDAPLSRCGSRRRSSYFLRLHGPPSQPSSSRTARARGGVGRSVAGAARVSARVHRASCGRSSNPPSNPPLVIGRSRGSGIGSCDGLGARPPHVGVNRGV